jgi:radical SAM protein with 4Fe4S-binding SPASM domain
MTKPCCEPSRDARINQYRLEDWQIKEPVYKTFGDHDVLHCPEYIDKEKDGIHLIIDPNSPNWISVNHVGTEILKLCDGRRTLSEVRNAISGKYSGAAVDADKIFSEVTDFVNAAGTLEFISENPFPRCDYKGRSHAIGPDKLDELWIYTTLSCNLRCRHCLVSAGKELEKELGTDEIKRIVDEAVELGVKRFYITGGEPFIKENIFEIIHYITARKERELIILSNATLFDEAKIESLKKLKGPRLVIQVSLEGPTAEIHDKLRGKGSFDRAVEGIKSLVGIGIVPIVSTAVSQFNADHIEETSRFISKLGVKDHHILWMHAKGRGASNVDKLYVAPEKITEIMRDVRKLYEEHDIIVDNEESLKARIRYKRGRKNDLCNNCYEKICVNADGHVYPCGSLNGDSAFDAGSVRERSLKDIWLNSEVMRCGRENSIMNKAGCVSCYLRFFCGGGCTSHSYYASEVDAGKGSISAADPYCATYGALYEDILWDLASEGVTNASERGYAAPVVYNAMDSKLPPYLSNAVSSIDDRHEVGCYHCSCVLSVDVEDDENVCKPEIKGQITERVKKKFGEVAYDPEINYYCPTGYDPKDLEHIPTEVLEVSYGCGNPAALAAIREGETILDLGSGAGIDCFIAAKKLGSRGRVIGVDMTDEMIEKATESARKVAEVLGYNVVEFRKGNIMELPADDNSVDLVISNCVINLTEEKAKVLNDIHRVLKPSGRFVISDIVSDKPVPGYMKRDKELWGACLSGALTDSRFIEVARNAGFPDVELTRNYLYKKVEYLNFYSVTLKGSKPAQEKISCCG